MGKDATPAASHIICKYGADSGIPLTACHNAGGPDKYFGINYKVYNGGPAPESVTNRIYEKTKVIQQQPPVSKLTFSIVDINNHHPIRMESRKSYICGRPLCFQTC